MLLPLTLLYLFHGFQTYASPLASRIVTESVGTAVLASTPACACPSDQRSIWSILWSSLATIFACAWVSIHPNVPAPSDRVWRVFLRRIELMFWAVIGPEVVIVWAFRQWLGARHLEKTYKGRGWTTTHGHFIQMGGFMLFEGDVAKGVMSPAMLSELLKEGRIEFPAVTVEEIEDRSKVDGFSKTIAISQTLWFIAQCFARRVQNLDVTPLELLTLSLAVLNGVMYFLWWDKPLDVRNPVPVYLLDSPGKQSKDSNVFDEPNDPNMSNNIPSTSNDFSAFHNLPDQSTTDPNKSIKSNDDDFVLLIGDCFGLYPILATMFKDMSSAIQSLASPISGVEGSPEIKGSSEREGSPETEESPETQPLLETAEPSSQEIPETPGRMIIMWQSLRLPTIDKLIVWIIISPIFIVGGIALLVFFLGLGLFVFLFFVGAFLILFSLWLSYLTLHSLHMSTDSDNFKFNPGDMKVPTLYFYELKYEERRMSLLFATAAGAVFGGIHCAGWLLAFPSSAEAILWRVCSVVVTGIALLLPLYAYTVISLAKSEAAFGAPYLVAIPLYILSRLLLLVEAFISLRHLTPEMLAVAN